MKIDIDENCSICNEKMQGIIGEFLVFEKVTGVMHLFCKKCVTEVLGAFMDNSLHSFKQMRQHRLEVAK